MREDIQSVLYSPETLAEKVRQMGQRISQDLSLIHISEPTRH